MHEEVLKVGERHKAWMVSSIWVVRGVEGTKCLSVVLRIDRKVAVIGLGFCLVILKI